MYDMLEVWFSEDEDGRRAAAIMGVEHGGQKVLVGSEVFGPFDTWRDVANWIWARLSLDPGAPLA